MFLILILRRFTNIEDVKMVLSSSSISIPVPIISTIPPSHLPTRRRYHYHYPQPHSFASNPLPVLRKQSKGSTLISSATTEPDFTVLTAINSLYNDIVIVDTAESRMLLLDSTHNIHSIFIKGQTWTGSYWDEFAALPAIIPKGPIAIFGLAGGTAAHLMLTLWPSLQLHGWEIDEILIDKAREHLGLSDLEKHTEGGGFLHVHIGDALSPSSSVSGGYAGIIIDLFSGGEVLPQLQEVETWLELNDKLMPNGRLMVNCGARNINNGSIDNENDDIWEKNSTLDVLCKAFPGQVNWKKMPKSEGENYLALTGPLPDFTMWADALPDRFSSSIKQWTSCFPS